MSTGISSDVIRGYNDTMILFLLLSEDSYGYEISKQIKSLSDEKLRAKTDEFKARLKEGETGFFIESLFSILQNRILSCSN